MASFLVDLMADTCLQIRKLTHDHGAEFQGPLVCEVIDRFHIQMVKTPRKASTKNSKAER